MYTAIVYIIIDLRRVHLESPIGFSAFCASVFDKLNNNASYVTGDVRGLTPPVYKHSYMRQSPNISNSLFYHDRVSYAKGILFIL